jgi:hypothetical protein
MFLAKRCQSDQMTHSDWWTAREKTWWRNRCFLTALPSFARPHILPYDGMTAFISFTQSCTQDPFYLFKEGVTMTYTRYFQAKCSTCINISPALVFIFLNRMNHQYVHIIMVSDRTNAQSHVQLTEHIHITFPLYSSSARTSPFADIIQAQEQHLVLKTVKKGHSTFCITQYLGSYFVRQVGRYGCLCIIPCSYTNAATNERENNTANKWNHKAET